MRNQSHIGKTYNEMSGTLKVLKVDAKDGGFYDCKTCDGVRTSRSVQYLDNLADNQLMKET